MNTNTCCFTGHRVLPTSKIEEIKYQVKTLIEEMIHKNVDTFLCGGAMGFDILCGEIVLELKQKYDISLILALPCKNQDKYYADADKNRYKFLTLHADKVIYISENYFNGCMHKRNRYMVEHSQYIISYCTKSSGGSYYTRQYAKSNKLCILDVI